MSYGPLPQRVDPRKLAERDAKLNGEIELDRLTEFCSFLVESKGSVDVGLEFSVDQQRLRTITGYARTVVQQTCQRCLAPVSIPIDARFNLALVQNEEQAKNLPRTYDPLMIDGDLYLASMVEEELILSLPAVAYHSDCTVETSFGDELDSGTGTQDDKPNPFSVLAALKNEKG